MKNSFSFKRLLSFVIVSILIVSAIEVKAGGADISWDGSSSTDWGTGANWSSGKVPSSRDCALIPSALSNYPDIGSSNYSVKQIKSMADGSSISGTGTITISDPNPILAVTGTVSIDCALEFTTAESAITCNGDLTISGVVSGVGTELAKYGTGTLTLSGLNSYTGSTWIGGGTISINSLADLNGSNSSLGAPVSPSTYEGVIYFSPNTTLLYTGSGHSSNRTFENWDGGGTIDASGSGALVLSGGMVGRTYAIVLTGSGQATNSSTISGTTITKSGSGTWTLSGANNYTGLTTISAGTLKVGYATSLGTTASGTTITSGAVLDLNGTNYSNFEALTLNGTGISSGGALINSSSIAATYAGLLTLASASSIVGGTASIAISHTGTLSGATFGLTLGGASGGSMASIIGTISGTLTKEGTGTWTLSGTNTYTGLTTISAGILKLANTSALGTTASGTTVSNGGALDLNGLNYSNTEALTINGDGISSNGAIMNTSASAATYAGLLTLGSDSKIKGEPGSIAITNTGTITGAGYKLIIGGNNGGSIASVIGTSSGSVKKLGDGTWTLSGANTFSGGVEHCTATLNINNAQALGTAAGTFTITAGSTIDNTSGGAITTLNYPMTWLGDFTFTGTDNLSLGTGTVSMSASSEITVTANTLDICGSISAASYDITKAGAGTLNLCANSVVINDMTVSGGIINTTSDNATVNGDLIINSGAALHIEPGVSISISGSITNTPGTNGLLLKSDATGTASLIYSGSISGTVERYIPVTSTAFYHYVSAPVASMTINNILDAGLGDYNAYEYDPTLPGGINSRWSRVFGADPMVFGMGYAIPYEHVSTESKTLSFAGSLNSSTNTASINNTNGYFHLLGNPFTAPISVSSLLTTNTNLNGAIYYWDDNGYPYSTSDYAIHNGSTSIQSGANSNPGQAYIGIGQGFFVQSNGTGASTVSFDATWRTSGQDPQFFTPDLMEIQVCKLSVTDENEAYNQIAITMQEGASKGYDRMYDAAKLKGNPNIAFYSFIDGDTTEYAIQGLPLSRNSESIQLGLDANQGGSYTIELDILEKFDPNTSVYLEDKQTGNIVNLKEKPQYSFTTSKEILTDRFVLHFNMEVVNNQEEIVNTPSVNIFVSGDQVQISNPDNKLLQVDVYDVLGKKITSQQIREQRQSIQLNNAHGYYIVKVYNGTSSYQEKVFLK